MQQLIDITATTGHNGINSVFWLRVTDHQSTYKWGNVHCYIVVSKFFVTKQTRFATNYLNIVYLRGFDFVVIQWRFVTVLGRQLKILVHSNCSALIIYKLVNNCLKLLIQISELCILYNWLISDRILDCTHFLVFAGSNTLLCTAIFLAKCFQINLIPSGNNDNTIFLFKKRKVIPAT